MDENEKLEKKLIETLNDYNKGLGNHYDICNALSNLSGSKNCFDERAMEILFNYCDRLNTIDEKMVEFIFNLDNVDELKKKIKIQKRTNLFSPFFVYNA